MYQNEYTNIYTYIRILYGMTEMDINFCKVIKIFVFPKANRNIPSHFFLLIGFK